MKAGWIWMVGVGVLALVAVSALPARAGAVKCRMKFNLQGWSAFYRTASGTGTITCDTGQSFRVSIKTTGGGLSVGKSKIANGSGVFSPVDEVSELFGAYAAAEAHAGVVKSADAQVVTKGTVSLALSGTGKGIDLGVGFAEFTIERRK